MAARTLVVLLALMLGAFPASAEKRVALVVGNGAYRDAPLRNPANDARAIAASLREAGFEVILRENAGKQALERALADFGEKLGPDAVGLFYFAGHGIQVRGQNYLVPVDAQIANEARVRVEAVDADLAVEQMAAAGAKVSLVILDACRNNPFERRFRSQGDGGLAQIRAPAGTLIAYATAPGRVAADGEGANSVYSAALASALRQPGLAVEDVFKQVRLQVSRATGGQQVPWESSSLTGDFVFRPGAAATASVPAGAPPLARAVDDPAAVEDAFWAATAGGASEGALKAYLERYPEGRHVAEARLKLAALEPRRGRFDGRWGGRMRCPAQGNPRELNRPMAMVVENDEALIDAAGDLHLRLSGSVLEDGRLVMSGAYVSGASSGFRLDGTIVDRTYKATGAEASGSWGRPCELELFKLFG